MSSYTPLSYTHATASLYGFPVSYSTRIYIHLIILASLSNMFHIIILELQRVLIVITIFRRCNARNFAQCRYVNDNILIRAYLSSKT